MTGTVPAAVADQRDLLCPSCAGQCVFDPEKGGLTCQSCGNTRTLLEDDGDNAAEEFEYQAGSPSGDVAIPEGARAHQCETCGGEVVFTGPALSDRCPYCDGPVVLAAGDAGYQSMALIPFRVAGEIAQDKAQGWVARRFAAPRDLSAVVAEARVAGLYAPFWTFDSTEAVRYWARYTTGSGKNRRTHRTSGSLSVRFDDLLAPASPHVTPLIRDGILHDFDPLRLRSYRTGYLAGFAAERHHQTVAEGLAANRPDKTLLIRNRVKKHIAKPRSAITKLETDTSGIRYRRILLPVWMLHYRHGGKPYKVVVSGIDGRTFGERPFSAWKLAGYSALLSGLAIAVGLVWGAAGFL